MFIWGAVHLVFSMLMFNADLHKDDQIGVLNL